MKPWIGTLLLVTLLAGCSTHDLALKPRLPSPSPDPTDPPGTRAVTGSVTYPWGEAVAIPKVMSTTGAEVFGDRQGHYRLLVPADARDVHVYARDGYDGRMSGTTYSGSAAVPDTAAAVTVDIVLTYASPA